MKIKAIIGGIGLLALGGSDVLSDPAFWDTGGYGYGNGYDPMPCTHDVNGVPSPGCGP